MRPKKITIYDVARELNLSKSTVSRAMTDSWEVSPETKRMVLSKASEMGYRPNAQARGLVTGCSHIIGYIVPDLLTSTYFTQVARSIQDTLLDKGYQLLITQSNESQEEERKLLKMMQSLNVDGLIISTVTDSDYNRDILADMLTSGTAMVFIGRVCSSIPAPKIVVDNEGMATEIVNHLATQGCRKIAYISGPSKILSNNRTSGYLKGLANNGLEYDSALVRSSGLFEKDGYDATLDLLDAGTNPDAIVAINDTVAFGVMKALKDRGMKIPEDIAVCGFSDSFASTIVEPNLTSTAPPLSEMGRLSAESILHQIEGHEAPDSVTVLGFELKVRSSSLRRHPQE